MLHAGGYPLSVQIVARETGSVVANDDAIGIKHGDNFENKIISQIFGILVITHQELKDTFYYKGGVGLSRMDPRRDYYGSSDGYVLWSAAEICYYCHLTVIQSKCFAYYGLSDSILRFRSTKSLKKLAAVTIRVRIAMSKINFIIVMFE